MCRVGALLDIHPLTPERWPDLVGLFGERGAISDCWCMFFRRQKPAPGAAHTPGARAAFEAVVVANQVPGLLAYRDGRPIGWVAVAPRSDDERVAGRGSGAAQDRDVWSIVCFYIDRRGRR